jgi:hypothetical protein
LQAFADARFSYDPGGRLLNDYFTSLLVDTSKAAAT